MTRIALIIAFAACAFGQATADGITTSASKTITLVPDNAVLTVNVTSATGTTVEQAAEWLANTGITPANLISAGSTLMYDWSSSTPVMRMAHQFQLTLPYAKAAEMMDNLRAAERVVAAAGGSMAYSVTLAASENAVRLARERVLPDLIAELKRRAESLATSSGLTLGTIQSISDAASVPAANAGSRNPIPITRSFPSDRFSVAQLTTGAHNLQAAFSASAKFSAIK